MPAPEPTVPDQAEVAASRVRFLTDETFPRRTVRAPIAASWQRSQDFHVSADKVEMSYVRDVQLDGRLSTSAEPVIRSLAQALEGQSVSIVLTDHSGLVLRRTTGDRELEGHLDRVLLAPGFNYAERFVGTNGIGTALESGGPAHVFGHEHYAEDLEDLACAGVPLHHPLTGRLVGAIDLTCWRRDAGALLLAMAKNTAQQIEQALLADAGANELGLFREYLRTCSRSAGAVFALSGDVVMLNDVARAVLDPADQAALLAQAAEAPPSAPRAAVAVELPSGRTARMSCRMVETGERVPGVVAQVKLDPDAKQGSDVRAYDQPARSQMALPGLVGTGAPWLHVCQEVEKAFRLGEWLAVEGEDGVGKQALLRAVQLRRQPVGRFVVVDSEGSDSDPHWSAGVRRSLREADSLVIRRVDRLGDTRLREVSSALRAARATERGRPLWVAVTLGPEDKSGKLKQLLQYFPSTIRVPPLRLHLEDLPLLVTLFLSRLTQQGQLGCSPETMRLLMRMSWPGNAKQLHQLLVEVVKRRRTGLIEPRDLPAWAHSVSRRVLSPLESIERDAIVRCLAESHGNKVAAAQSLGMSRATIYRKIHEYGIVASS